jgi:hypothetical protein
MANAKLSIAIISLILNYLCAYQYILCPQEVGGTLIGEDRLVVMAEEESVE